MPALVTIRFAHTPSLESWATALNMRKNGTTDALIPEWVPGRTASDSKAVYAISDIRVRLIKIRVRLSSSEVQQGPLFVRAVAYIPSDQRQRGCNFFATLFTSGTPNVEDVNEYILGDVEEQSVSFTSGLSEELEFTVAQRGVDYIASGRTQWMWEYRSSPKDKWTAFGQSDHTIYTVLAHPTAPWVLSATDEPSRHHLIWTDVLDHACWWARGQRTLEDVAAAITQQLFERGSSSLNLLRYEHDSGGSSFVADMHTHQFDLLGFLNAIDLSRSSPTTVNCDDCSCALVTFANALGCDLWVVPVGARPQKPGGLDFTGQIYMNPIRVIGSAWNDVITTLRDTDLGSYFYYHSVAMTGNGTFQDYVYDGMLQVNANDPPYRTPPPPEPLFVKKFRFGDAHDTDHPHDRLYRYRFAKLNTLTPPTRSQNYCTPRSDLKYRPVLWWG